MTKKSEQVIIVPLDTLILPGIIKVLKTYATKNECLIDDIITTYLEKIVKSVARLNLEEIFYNGSVNNWANVILFESLNKHGLINGRPNGLNHNVDFINDMSGYALAITQALLKYVQCFGNKYELADMYVEYSMGRLANGRKTHYMAIHYTKVLENGRYADAYLEAKPYIRSVVFGVLLGLGPLKLVRLIKVLRNIRTLINIIEGVVIEAEADLKDKDAREILKGIIVAGLETKVKEYVSINGK